MMPLPELYTVSRCTKDGELYEQVHSSSDAYTTRCGVEITQDGKWYVLSNTLDRIATCKKCVKATDNSKAYYENQMARQDQRA